MPIGKAHILHCDSVGYQNELLCAYSQTDGNTGLRDTWTGCNAGYYILHRLEERFCDSICFNYAILFHVLDCG